MRVLRLAAPAAIALLARALPAQLPGAEPEWYLPTGDGCRLFVQEFGGPARDTVIALHGGWGAEHSYLLPAFDEAAARYHLVLYDQRGSLRSPCPDSLISLERHVADLERLRETLGLGRATLAGHSMGTLLAMAYLSRHPDRVRGLVLFGAVPPAAPLSTGQDSVSRAFFRRPAVAAELAKAGVASNSSRLTPKQRTTAWRIRFAGVNVYHVERWREMRGGQVYYNARAGAAAARTVPPDFDFTPALAAHPCPVWVINGDHDYVDMGAARHRRWTAAARSARLVVLKDAGHAAWLDAPREFRRELLRALESATRC